MSKSFVSLAAALVALLALPLVQVFAAAAAKPAVHDEVHECRRVMAEAADHALNSADSLLNLVAKSDRDRIEKELTKADENAYKAAGDKVQELWKKKFGEKFSAEGHVDDLKDLKPIVTGAGKDQKAVILFPVEPGEKPYELHLTRERSGYWRINLPDTLDGKTFAKNMMASVNKVIADFDKIPDDKAKAYERVVTELLHEMAFPSAAAAPAR